VLRLLVLASLALSLSSCTPDDAPSHTLQLSLHLDRSEAPADGLSIVHVQAALAGAPSGAVVTFAVRGIGLLSATNASVDDGGIAAVDLFAPFEDELTDDVMTSTVSASILVDGALLSSSAQVSFGTPTEGAPVLDAHAEPDRVVAGSADAITIVVDGRRLTDRVVSVSADSTALALPESIELDDALHGELVVAAPSAPMDVRVTLSVAGAEPVHVELHFIAPDAPAFDLSGTFAEVSYGVVKIGDLAFLDPDPQCVVAPTLLLVEIEQQGAHLTLTSTTCDIQMPSVNVILVGTSITTVGPGFIDATNARSTGALSFELAAVGPGADFNPPASAFDAPLVVGADLDDPDDALPTSADDPRVTDDDGDGLPGVTITNSNQGAQHCVFRTITHGMSGLIESSDVVTGIGTADTESNILNGGGISPTVTAQPSPFHFQRVDGRNGAPDIAGRDGDATSISCDDVKAFAAELEAAAPPPDASTACL
jgi:hypothetical protein